MDSIIPIITKIELRGQLQSFVGIRSTKTLLSFIVNRYQTVHGNNGARRRRALGTKSRPGGWHQCAGALWRIFDISPAKRVPNLPDGRRRRGRTDDTTAGERSANRFGLFYSFYGGSSSWRAKRLFRCRRVTPSRSRWLAGVRGRREPRGPAPRTHAR